MTLFVQLTQVKKSTWKAVEKNAMGRDSFLLHTEPKRAFKTDLSLALKTVAVQPLLQIMGEYCPLPTVLLVATIKPSSTWTEQKIPWVVHHQCKQIC